MWNTGQCTHIPVFHIVRNIYTIDMLRPGKASIEGQAKILYCRGCGIILLFNETGGQTCGFSENNKK